MTRNPCNKEACLVGGCSPHKQLILQSIKLLWWILICLHLVCHKIVLKNLQRLLPKVWDVYGCSCLMCLRFSTVFHWCYFRLLVVLGRHHTFLSQICCIATWTSTLQCLTEFHTHSCSSSLSEHPDFSLQVQVCSVRKASVDTFKFVLTD